MQSLITSVEQQIQQVLNTQQGTLDSREDSRAFGAMIEKKITDSWDSICEMVQADKLDVAGRRTIYDCAFKNSGVTYGFDIKTKDLDKTRYSDGGVCSLGNLLRFSANDNGVFVIVEIGHEAANNQSRSIEYVRVVPFEYLPIDTYRIENLGTGQFRLNYSLNDIYSEIEWNRERVDFYNIICDLALKHFKRITSDATRRIKDIENFRDNGFRSFKFS